MTPDPSPEPTLDFVARGACRESDADFFPERGANNFALAEVRAICNGCKVRAECLAWGLAHENVGIWGGTSERERRDMRRRMGVPRKAPQGELRVGHPVWGRAS